MELTINNTKHSLSEDGYIDAGAEAKVYSLDNNTLVKVLNTQSKTENKINKILALCDKYDYLSGIKGFEHIAVPIDPAYDGAAICGFTMPFFENCKTINELCYDIVESRYAHSRITDLDLFKIIKNLFEILQILHLQKIILGDINSNNILWHTKTNAVYIIDLDSAKVGDFYAKMAMPEYLCPIVKKIGEDTKGGLSFSTSSDIYALTIVCFELLVGCHPCDVGTQPVTDRGKKMELGVTYLSYHALSIKRHQNHLLFDSNSKMVFRRLDIIKRTAPRIYGLFLDVFHYGKRGYLNRKTISQRQKPKRTRTIKAIRTHNGSKKQTDPRELRLFLDTYNLKLPYHVK